MEKYVEDLRPYDAVEFPDFMAEHYKIERLIELLIMTAADISFHLLSMRGEAAPGSYRAAFLRLGELNILDQQLSKNLALGAGLRNILVHEYEAIDYRLLGKSIPQVIKDVEAFMGSVSKQI
ncbi:MAG: DUF86 domain-containing protein [Desulforhabdus sp.]|nr:DUF86 domain-containing protein [Desulforhabdus sp.]